MGINFTFYIIVGWLILMNLCAFLLMVVDKQRARSHAWRISERTLLSVAFLGGGIGSLIGMYAFRHKTKHVKFILLVPMAVIINILVAGIILYYL